MTYTSPFTGDVIQPTDVSYRSFSMSADIILSWPINGNATGNYAARIMEVTPTVGSLKLYMPPANQTSVGTDALIRNKGAVAFTVVDFSGNTIISIPAGVAEYIYVTANPTVGGTWGIIAFGTGTSSADAASLAGLGLIAVSATLNLSHPVSSIASNYTFAASDRAQTVVWSSGAGNLTLPSAPGLGNNWFTLFKNNGTGTVTIGTTASQLIDGSVSKNFNPDESSFIICTGTEFVTVGYGQNSTFAFTALVKPVTTGTVTLTSLEASNNIQEYVGSLTGNVTVVYPPVVNLYVVSNQVTANGFTVTVSTGVAGGINATVAAGQQATLVCDGVNFLNANTVQAGGTSFQLINGTVTVPSLSFGAETNTGVYRPGIGRFGVTIQGTQILDVNTAGVSVTGVGAFSGAVSGTTGTFPSGIAGGVFP